jgi:hypothetical protein
MGVWRYRSTGRKRSWPDLRYYDGMLVCFEEIAFETRQNSSCWRKVGIVFSSWPVTPLRMYSKSEDVLVV